MAVRKGMRRRARRHGLAGLAVLGAMVSAGVVVGWGVSPVETREISPADVVALRFPADWNDDTTGSAPAAPLPGYALASADSQPLDTDILFSPHPTLALPMSAMAMASAADVAEAQASAEPRPVSTAVARADAPSVARAPVAHPVAPAPARPASPHVRKDTGMLFNDAQLANIKSRLKLSAYQEQYWPEVASALRDIGARAAHGNGAARGNGRLAAIDPDGPEVQRLKSAAFPLIMSMNDEQKHEVRMLAEVMGLQSVAASF